MKKLKFLTVMLFAACLTAGAFCFVACGEATESFLFSADSFYAGTTYKINVKGMSDGTCTLTCAQASPKLEVSGKYTFEDGKGYTFDMGEKVKLLAGYNAYSGNHYIVYDLAFNADHHEKLILTCKDDKFTPAENYTDQYDNAAEMLFTGQMITTDESIKLRDYGDGTFDIMSFGSSEVFDYGTVSDAGDTRTYTLTDGTKIVREASTTVTGAYRVTYETVVSAMMGGSTIYEHNMYALNGSTVDAAFPDPRGEVTYLFSGKNIDEFPVQGPPGTAGKPAGTVPCTLKCFTSKGGDKAYEITVINDGESWYSETGVWSEDGNSLTFTPESGDPYNGDKSGFVLTVTKSGSKSSTVVKFQMAKQ